MHFCCVKEDPHLCLGARFIKRNRVKNIISIYDLVVVGHEIILAPGIETMGVTINGLHCSYGKIGY